MTEETIRGWRLFHEAPIIAAAHGVIQTIGKLDRHHFDNSWLQFHLALQWSVRHLVNLEKTKYFTLYPFPCVTAANALLLKPLPTTNIDFWTIDWVQQA
jgi:inhibitor of KinA sporulation pathway (predicted exonuclease)